jgi:hypothetical protein
MPSQINKKCSLASVLVPRPQCDAGLPATPDFFDYVLQAGSLGTENEVVLRKEVKI